MFFASLMVCMGFWACEYSPHPALPRRLRHKCGCANHMIADFFVPETKGKSLE